MIANGKDWLVKKLERLRDLEYSSVHDHQERIYYTDKALEFVREMR